MTIGIDLVDIKRFAHWHTYPDARLRKVFSPQEIAYCRAIPAKSAERFAARYAAKEALFKTLAPYASTTVPLLTLFSHSELCVGMGVTWNIDWPALQAYYTLGEPTKFTISTSLTHTETAACAVVILCLLP